MEVLITSSKITQHAINAETERLLMKGNLNKTDFRKAMISAWGESESEAETEIPAEEGTTIYVSWLHTTARMKSLKEKR